MKTLPKLITAIMKNKVSQVGHCLELGISPNATEDADNVTPLHFAVLYQAYDAAMLLLTQGADARAKNREGDTPIDLAQQATDPKMLAILLLSFENLSVKH